MTISCASAPPDGTSGNDVKHTIAKASQAFFAHDGRYVVAHAGSEFIGRAGLIPGLVTRPVRAGETITIYGTGFGLSAPGTQPELLVTAPAPLASPVAVRIGGAAASVAYAGQVGSGLYQFNVVVPQLPAGDHGVDAEITTLAVTAAMYLTVQSAARSASPALTAADRLAEHEGALSQFIRRAVFVLQPLVGRIVVGELFRFAVPLQMALRLQGDVGDQRVGC